MMALTWFHTHHKDGTMKRSNIFNLAAKGALQMVFSFIVSMMGTAMKRTLNTTTNQAWPAARQEINNLHDEVWSKVYASIEESFLVPSVDSHLLASRRRVNDAVTVLGAVPSRNLPTFPLRRTATVLLDRDGG